MKIKIFVLLTVCSMTALAGGYKVVRVEKEIPGVDHYHILACDNGKKTEVLEYPKKRGFLFQRKEIQNPARGRKFCLSLIQ